LDAAEADLVYARQLHLNKHPLAGDYDLAHLKAIHHYLFQDVYPFAGQLRTVDMHKANDPTGGFFPAARLQDGAEFVFTALHEDNLLQGLDQETFTDRLAHHLDQLNHLHPFREGNGRTQRTFLGQLSTQAGYRLDWSTIRPADNDEASKQGAVALRSLLQDVVKPSAHAASPDSDTAAAPSHEEAAAAFQRIRERQEQRRQTQQQGAAPSGRRREERPNQQQRPSIEPNQ